MSTAMGRTGRRRRIAAAAATVAVAAGLWGGAPAGADTDGPTVVATGLNNPRQLAFSPGGQLYVAEAGLGGSGPCQVGELGEVCFGLTGSVAKVGRTGVTRVVQGLPSAGGSDVIGPSDIVFTGNHRFALTIGLGGSPDYRAGFGPDAALLGSVVTGDLRHPGAGVRRVFDVAGYEQRANPDGTDVDSNAVGLARKGNGFVVADAGGNDVVSTRHGGSTVGVLPPVPTTKAAEGLPVGFPADAVPTDVVKGPDGAWYVSQLVGYPFEAGASTIWRIVPGHRPKAYATGLTNVTSLAFDEHGRLYAVELSATGLLSGGPGDLVAVKPWSSSHRVVAAGLPLPYGVAIRGESAYVTTCSTFCPPGAGSVMKVHLHH
ncbi:ScyD/ScyE family protein [Intrasporangium flavum]|uniref:ScyD/ScyE family protein n=1 Tax=Intrasporangium flavum TaxID=1428657 RepID=UPI001A965E68|nr:ScyD/ScyE family protein [Intrasporangium flavum]